MLSMRSQWQSLSTIKATPNSRFPDSLPLLKIMCYLISIISQPLRFVSWTVGILSLYLLAFLSRFLSALTRIQDCNNSFVCAIVSLVSILSEIVHPVSVHVLWYVVGWWVIGPTLRASNLEYQANRFRPLSKGMINQDVVWWSYSNYAGRQALFAFLARVSFISPFYLFSLSLILFACI